jgi:hypothetical protein
MAESSAPHYGFRRVEALICLIACIGPSSRFGRQHNDNGTSCNESHQIDQSWSGCRQRPQKIAGLYNRQRGKANRARG